MAIEYIGEVTLRAPQHIEDKLEALAEKATQGSWENIGPHPWFEFDRVFAGSTFICSTNNTDMPDKERGINAGLIVALHNAAPALLAVVRAAREVNAGATDEDWRALGAALSALDAVEV